MSKNNRLENELKWLWRNIRNALNMLDFNEKKLNDTKLKLENLIEMHENLEEKYLLERLHNRNNDNRTENGSTGK